MALQDRDGAELNVLGRQPHASWLSHCLHLRVQNHQSKLILLKLPLKENQRAWLLRYLPKYEFKNMYFLTKTPCLLGMVSKIFSTGSKQLFQELATRMFLIQWEYNSSQYKLCLLDNLTQIFFCQIFSLVFNRSHPSNTKNINLISSLTYINISMESAIHHHSVLVCPFFKFFFKKWLQYSFGKKQFFYHTQVICVRMKLQITACHKIRLCKISFGKWATQSWILHVRFKNTNETK